MLFELGEDLGAAVFEEVEDVFEALGAAVVGVGDLCIRMFGTVVAELLYLMLVGAAGEGDEVGVVFVVHSEDEVEDVEVGGGDLAGGAGHGESAFAAGGGHALVGGVTGVVADGASGIDGDLIGEAFLFEEVSHDIFAGGGAADVSHADEEDGGDVGLGHGEKLKIENWRFKIGL